MLLVVCGTALPAFCTGCLITRHTTNTVRKNEKPVAVQFESPRAKNVFESKLVEVRAVQNMIAANPRVVAVLPDSGEQPLEARQPQAPLPPGILR